jgi:hypothetical protein
MDQYNSSNVNQEHDSTDRGAGADGPPPNWLWNVWIRAEASGGDVCQSKHDKDQAERDGERVPDTHLDVLSTNGHHGFNDEMISRLKLAGWVLHDRRSARRGGYAGTRARHAHLSEELRGYWRGRSSARKSLSRRYHPPAPADPLPWEKARRRSGTGAAAGTAVANQNPRAGDGAAAGSSTFG